MGTTGTIMGVSKYLKEQNPDIQIIGLQPSEGSNIAGIRRYYKNIYLRFSNQSVLIKLWIFRKLKRKNSSPFST